MWGTVLLSLFALTSSLSVHSPKHVKHLVNWKEPPEEKNRGEDPDSPFMRRHNLPDIIFKARPNQPDKLMMNLLDDKELDSIWGEKNQLASDAVNKNDAVLKQAAQKAFDKNGMIYITQPKNDPDVPNINYLMSKVMDYKLMSQNKQLRMAPESYFSNNEIKQLKVIARALDEEPDYTDINGPGNVRQKTNQAVRQDLINEMQVVLQKLEKNILDDGEGPEALLGPLGAPVGPLKAPVFPAGPRFRAQEAVYEKDALVEENDQKNRLVNFDSVGPLDSPGGPGDPQFRAHEADQKSRIFDFADLVA